MFLIGNSESDHLYVCVAARSLATDCGQRCFHSDCDCAMCHSSSRRRSHYQCVGGAVEDGGVCGRDCWSQHCAPVLPPRTVKKRPQMFRLREASLLANDRVWDSWILILEQKKRGGQQQRRPLAMVAAAVAVVVSPHIVRRFVL